MTASHVLRIFKDPQIKRFSTNMIHHGKDAKFCDFLYSFHRILFCFWHKVSAYLKESNPGVKYSYYMVIFPRIVSLQML